MTMLSFSVSSYVSYHIRYDVPLPQINNGPPGFDCEERQGKTDLYERLFTHIMMFTLYKAQDPLDVECYKVIGTAISKVIILPRLKALSDVNKQK